MQYSKKKAGGQEAETAGDSGNCDRRRVGRVVHDDRGNAIVQWEEAPPDYERPVLEVESSGLQGSVHRRLGSHGLSLQDSASFDPYSSAGALERKPSQRTGNTSRTDLRKLSEWIKMMRELEQRKQRDDGEEE